MGQQQARSDREPAIRLGAGGPAAFSRLYDRHVEDVHDFLVRFVRDPSAAEDLTQSTFLRAIERPGGSRDPSDAGPLLYAVAYGLAVEHIATQRADPAGDEPAVRAVDAARLPGEAAAAREAAELVWAAASGLEARQYAAIDLSARRGLSMGQIAGVLDVPVGVAGDLVERAREALGGTVRELLVARQRGRCDRLAALVPTGTRALTADLRAAVDQHVRECERCQEIGLRLASPSALFGALLPMPLPVTLGGDGRDPLAGGKKTAPAGTPPSPPRRVGSRRARWLVAATGVLVVLVLGATAAYVVMRPAEPAPLEPGRAQGLADPGLAGTAMPPNPTAVSSRGPSPRGQASPGSSPSAAAPPIVMVTSTSTPAPPTAAPRPPFSVASVAVTSLDPGACPAAKRRPGRSFACSFRVTVGFANSDGRGLVLGTLTASSQASGETRSAAFQLTAPVGSGSASTSVIVDFSRCPEGTASATIQQPGPAASDAAPFGAC